MGWEAGKGGAGDGQGGSGAARDTLTTRTVLENEKRFMGLTGVSLFPLKGGPGRWESQGGTKEAREPGWEACPGNLTTWTPHLPPPSTQGAPLHTPGPQGWSLGSRTHSHTLTYTHTHSHTLTHTQHSPYTKGHQRPKPRKEILYQSVRKFVSTGRTGQSREKKKKKKKPMGYLLIHPGSHLVRRFGEALRQDLRFWLPQARPPDFSQP